MYLAAQYPDFWRKKNTESKYPELAAPAAAKNGICSEGFTEKKREPKRLSWRVILKIGCFVEVFFLHNHVWGEKALPLKREPFSKMALQESRAIFERRAVFSSPKTALF